MRAAVDREVDTPAMTDLSAMAGAPHPTRRVVAARAVPGRHRPLGRVTGVPRLRPRHADARARRRAARERARLALRGQRAGEGTRDARAHRVPPGPRVLPRRRRPGVHGVDPARPGRRRQRRGALRARFAPSTAPRSGPTSSSRRESLPDTEGDDVPDHADDPAVVHFTTEPGDIVVHHARTIHGAFANATPDRRRHALSIRYAGDDTRFRIKPGAPQKVHHAGAGRGRRALGAGVPEGVAALGSGHCLGRAGLDARRRLRRAPPRRSRVRRARR